MRMPLIVTLTSGAFLPVAALACPGKTQTAADTTSSDESLAKLDPSACAKKAALVGSGCSYSTGMMANRVLEQGKAHSFSGALAMTDVELESRVAAPFVTTDGVRVIANEVVESVADPSTKHQYEGKLLEVDGTRYFVVTGYGKSAA